MAKLSLYLLLIIFLGWLSSAGFANTWQNDPFHSSFRPSSLSTSAISVHYIQANKLAKLLANKKLTFLSQQGSIINDEHSIYVTDTKSNINRIKHFIAKIDQPSPQILIQAQIIHIDNNYTKSLGLKFSAQPDIPNKQDALNFALPEINHSVTSFYSPLVTFGHTILNIELSALEAAGHAKLLSSPQLITLNNHSAVIESGEEVPYQQTTASGATSVSFKKAVLRLQVTPQIMPQHKILLKLRINQDKVSTLSVNGVPAISTQQMQTQLLVNDKQTLILGGIIERSHTQQKEGLPILNKLPIIGRLFQHTVLTNQQRELLIIITPTILNLPKFPKSMS